MSSQRNKSKHMKLGYNNEKLVIENLLKDSCLIKESYRYYFVDIYDIDLVMNKKSKYLKITIHFITSVKTRSIGYRIFLIECKIHCISRS